MGRLKNMTTLKELVANQNLTGNTDIQIIKVFFTLNDMEEEGMDLFYALTKSKIEKMKSKHHMSVERITYLSSRYLYETYNLEIADKLYQLELDYLVHGGELTNIWLEWAQGNVPNIIKPEHYFFPLVDWLEERGIKFKERKT